LKRDLFDPANKQSLKRREKRLLLTAPDRSCETDALIEEKIFGQTEPLPPSNSMLRKLQLRSNMCNQPSSLIFNRREVKRKKKKEREDADHRIEIENGFSIKQLSKIE